MKQEYFWKQDKVTLRALKDSDSENLYEALCDTSLRMQAEGGIALPVTDEVAEDMIQYAIEMTKEGSQLWFAVVDCENQLVGYAILGYINERDGNAHCDVNIFPKYEGKGYGKSVFEIILKYAFFERRLHKVNTFIMEGNEPAKRSALEAGFSLEAHRMAQFFSHGQYFYQEYYGITRPEFEFIEKRKDIFDVEAIEENVKKADLRGLLEERPYFWMFENIIVREMTEEDYLKNREMYFRAKDARFYDNDVKLPLLTEKLTEKEEMHLNFGGDGSRVEFAIVNLEGEYVGNVNLHSIDDENGTFSISFYFLEKHRKKGYATNAVALIVHYAFSELQLNKLNVSVNEGNIPSETVIKKIGCKKEGVYKENVFYDGKYVDVNLYGITSKQFYEYLEKTL